LLADILQGPHIDGLLVAGQIVKVLPGMQTISDLKLVT
jgi:hypothetical protein